MSQVNGNITHRMHDQQVGFTLVELIIVLVLLGVLASIALAYVDLSPTKGKVIYDREVGVARAAQHFARDTGCYPASLPILYNPNLAGDGTGLAGCQPNFNQWSGPYLTGMVFSGAGEQLAQNVTDFSGSVLAIETGGWLDATPQMSGAGTTEIAAVAGPLSPQVQSQVCRRCGGCVQADASSGPATRCFENSSSVGYVFATE